MPNIEQNGDGKSAVAPLTASAEIIIIIIIIAIIIIIRQIIIIRRRWYSDCRIMHNEMLSPIAEKKAVKLPKLLTSFETWRSYL